MKKISIQLNQKYKSFESGFSYEFEGDLIVLSGVNGSGKSQLMDIISQKEGRGSRKSIDVNILLGSIQINRSDILYRSFRENISVPELTHAGTEMVGSHKGQAWNAYNQYRLDFNNENLWDYQKSCKSTKEILLKKFGEQKFQSGQITQDDFLTKLPTDFVWKSDDIFTNFVGELFFNYATKIYHAYARAGKTRMDPDLSKLSNPPWKQLNSLFRDLGLEYRFKDDFYIEEGFQINEQPILYQIKTDGTIDESEPRKLADLSDGEKAIIALSFASLSGVKNEDKKILLLDEFDANFNPSLTEVFYEILDRYFVSKGILVIIATHSPTTISLAPNTTSFYELFKPNHTTADKRIFPVQQDEYLELKVAHKSFYAKLTDQSGRVAELKDKQKELESTISKLDAQLKPVIYVEGEIDQIYFEKAIEVFNKAGGYPAGIRWIGHKDEKGMTVFTGKSSLEKAEQFLLSHNPNHKIVLFYDVDCNKQTKTEENLTIYCPTRINNAKYKAGVEHLLVVPDTFDIHSSQYQELKYEGDKVITTPSKNAIKEYVLSLSNDQQKQWLVKIYNILEDIKSKYLA